MINHVLLASSEETLYTRHLDRSYVAISAYCKTRYIVHASVSRHGSVIQLTSLSQSYVVGLNLLQTNSFRTSRLKRRTLLLNHLLISHAS